MKRSHRYWKVASLVLTTCGCSSAFATGSEICYSAPVSFGVYAAPTNATVFNCPLLGAMTLPQLAALGWSVVRLLPQTVAGTDISDQLVLKRGVSIHRDGFES